MGLKNWILTWRISLLFQSYWQLRHGVWLLFTLALTFSLGAGDFGGTDWAGSQQFFCLDFLFDAFPFLFHTSR